MKRVLFLVIMISIIACNDNDKNNATGVNRWRINDSTAVKMKKYLKDCSEGCVDSSNVVNYNRKVYDSIQEEHKGWTISPVPARYKDKDDEDRYGSLRGLTGDARKVKGHKTIIYMVQSKATNGDGVQTEFFDIVTICPPPRNCKSDSSLSENP